MFATVCHLFVGDIIPISKTNSIADSGGIFDPRTQPKTAAFWAAYPSAHLSLAVCSAMCIVRWVLRFLVGFSAASAQDFGFPADASDSCNDSCQADSVPLIQLGRPEKGCADEDLRRAVQMSCGPVLPKQSRASRAPSVPLQHWSCSNAASCSRRDSC